MSIRVTRGKPVPVGGAYTQTYAGTTRTHAQAAALGPYVGTSFNGIDAVGKQAIADAFNQQRLRINELKDLVNSVIDDLQAQELVS